MLYCPSCGDRVVKAGTGSDGKQRYRCTRCDRRTVNPGGIDHVDKVFNRKKIESHVKEKADIYVITSAQNATPVNEVFLNTLLRYCKERRAKLVVIPYRYKNPTSVFSDKNYDWWDDRILPWIADTRFNITPNLQLMGDIKIQPTASKPLSGLDSMTGIECAIFGHPKVQLKSIATRPGDMAKILTTTGSVTVPNYTNSKAGKRGLHHHSYSAVVVEKDGDYFHMRHITACCDGSFIDLDREYYSDKPSDLAPSAEGIILGDLHHMFINKKVDAAVFGKKGIVSILDPLKIVFHDVVDSYSISHHHKANPFIKYAKHKSKANSIQEELNSLIEYLQEKVDVGYDVYVVPSNHHGHISKWLAETDWRTDPENAEFYLETALHMVRNSSMGKNGAAIPDPFAYWINKECPDVNVCDEGEGLKIGEFECGMHGHIGPNGSRGSLDNLSKIGTKVIIGHSHSPGREDGSLSVGTSSILDMEYAKGPSSWLHTHAIIYGNGKPTLITVLPNGKWRR